MALIIKFEPSREGCKIIRPELFAPTIGSVCCEDFESFALVLVVVVTLGPELAATVLVVAVVAVVAAAVVEDVDVAAGCVC